MDGPYNPLFIRTKVYSEYWEFLLFVVNIVLYYSINFKKDGKELEVVTSFIIANAMGALQTLEVNKPLNIYKAGGEAGAASEARGPSGAPSGPGRF